MTRIIHCSGPHLLARCGARTRSPRAGRWRSGLLEAPRALAGSELLGEPAEQEEFFVRRVRGQQEAEAFLVLDEPIADSFDTMSCHAIGLLESAFVQRRRLAQTVLAFNRVIQNGRCRTSNPLTSGLSAA
jgi:hypothetical protein